MFIELTDHLRCPADHPESFLVLLPDTMAGRRVATGSLGCPQCGQVYQVRDGSVDFGGSAPLAAATQLTPEAAATLLGLEGPGGYIAVFGTLAGDVDGLATALPGIRLVLVNPPGPVPDSDLGSVVRSHRSPIKARSMRGVAVSADHGSDPEWVDAAANAVLPGNPVIVEGPPVERADLAIVASMPGLWVARKKGAGRGA